MKFNKDADLGAMAYDRARQMRTELKTKTPAPTKSEQHAILASTNRLRHDSARNN